MGEAMKKPYKKRTWIHEELRAAILAALPYNTIVTAQTLSAQLGISDRTVYRHMALLRKEGHRILSQASVGYMRKPYCAPRVRVVHLGIDNTETGQ